MSQNLKFLSAFLFMLALTVSGSHAALVNETFSTDASGEAAVLAAYPQFNYTGTALLNATGGQLTMTDSSTTSTLNALTVAGLSGDLLISTDVGKSSANSSYNVGVQLGNNRLVFHPGFPTIPGAFRVEGPGGFGNTSMGFVPPEAVMHKMEVSYTASTGRALVVIQDGSNANNLFFTTFTNLTAAGGPVGVTMGDGATPGLVAQFDNLSVTQNTGSTKGDSGWVNTVANSNPLHWYRLDEIDSNIAVDSGSARIDAVYRGGVVQGVDSKLGGAVRFNGGDDNVLINQPNLAGPWTAEFVLQNFGNSFGSDDLLLGLGIALKLEQFNNTGEIGYTQFGVADRVFGVPGSTPEEADGFQHIVFTGEVGTGLSLWLNGVLIGTNANYIDLPLTTLGQTTLASVDANLDEFVVYNRVLSDGEIQQHFAAFASAQIPEPASAILLAFAGLTLTRRRNRKA